MKGNVYLPWISLYTGFHTICEYYYLEVIYLLSELESDELSH